MRIIIVVVLLTASAIICLGAKSVAFQSTKLDLENNDIGMFLNVHPYVILNWTPAQPRVSI